MPPADIVLVSLGTTPGLRRADQAFAELVRAAGASCRVVAVTIGPSGRLRRYPALTDLVEAVAARRASRGLEARAVVFSTVTAALLAHSPRPYAVRFDAPAALNRPGLGGAWQRARERRVLRGARLLLPWGQAAAAALPASVSAEGGPALVTVPVPIDTPIAPAGTRDVDAVAYAGYPRKRGLELVCEAWSLAAPDGARLVIGGVDAARGRAWLERTGVAEPHGIEWAGPLPRADWLELVGRARLFVNASRWEDHGLAQLEALAAGAALVTVASPGPYEALPLARALDTRLVAASLDAAALGTALGAGLALSEHEHAAYAARAAQLLAPYRPEAVARTIADEVLPALGLAPARAGGA